MKGLFTDEVIITMLQFIREKNLYKKIDGRKTKNSEVYEGLAKDLNEHFGLQGKLTGQQVNTKWKSLKSQYYTEKMEQSKSGERLLFLLLLL